MKTPRINACARALRRAMTKEMRATTAAARAAREEIKGSKTKGGAGK